MKKKFDYAEWYSIVEPIITSREFIKRHTFKHHGNTSVFTHCVRVSKCSYRIAKSLKTDYKSAAIAGLLHDLYTTPWQDQPPKPLFQKHGFTHARDALNNSRKYYKKYLNKKIENAILRHMFPLNITPPKYLTGYIITIADKVMSMDMLTSRESMAKVFSFKRI